MGKYHICVYTICKNEEQFVDRWMDSMKEADSIVVTDTGSTDHTVEKLRTRGATVYIDPVSPWRFDVARNKSLEHVPEDADICVCTDLDETLDPGWRECIEKAWKPGTKTGKYLYNWNFKPDGTPDIQFQYFKVHTRQGFVWKEPIHEYLRYVGEGCNQTVFIEGMVLNHYPDPSKSRGSYLNLLELAVNEDPENDRNCYYLGREYMYKGDWKKCIETLKRHLALPSATWNEERCASMRWIALSYLRLGDSKESFRWYLRAVAEAPYLREPYIECAKMGYELQNWPVVLCMVEEALKIREKSTTYVNMGYSWDYTPYDLGALACYYLSMYDRSLEYAREALLKSPEDPRLQNNLKLIENKIKSL